LSYVVIIYLFTQPVACGWQLGSLYLSAFTGGHTVYKVGTGQALFPFSNSRLGGRNTLFYPSLGMAYLFIMVMATIGEM